jgi:hypothetical protein
MANSGLNVDLLILALAFFIKLKALILISPIPIRLASSKFVILNILIIYCTESFQVGASGVII